MEVNLTIWDKTTGKSHRLIDHDISEVKAGADTGPGRHGRIDCLQVAKSGELLEITALAENVELDGNYKVKVWLTKNEIANLARIAFSEDRYVIDALSAKPGRESKADVDSTA